MKKIFTLLLLLAITCVSSRCFAEEISKKPFLDFSTKESQEAFAIRQELSNGIVTPIAHLEDKLTPKGEYEEVIHCLVVETLTDWNTAMLVSYEDGRFMIAQYNEKSKTNVERLIKHLKSLISKIPRDINFIRDHIASSKNKDFITLANKAISELEKLNQYYGNQLDALEKFQQEQFK